jgi:alanyl-tRNA synthetase
MFTIAICDGLIPDDRSAGYLLRKVIRRAIAIASNDFKISSPLELMSELALITAEILGEAFPEVQQNLKSVINVVNEEIDKYETAITRNKRIVKALSGINTKYSTNLGEELINKLNKIKDCLQENSVNKTMDKKSLNSSKKELLNIRDILSDHTIASRHHLPVHLNDDIDYLINEINKLEDILDSDEQILIESLSKEFEEVINSNEFIVHNIKTKGDMKTVFKISYDYFGAKPSALFYVMPNNDEFYCQFSVPNYFQNNLKANEWLTQVANKLSNIEILSNKRIHKLSSLKCTSVQQIDEAISAAKQIATLHFTKL